MFFIPGVYQIPQNHVAIVERFGKFQEVAGAGILWINPMTCALKSIAQWGNVANKESRYIELAEQQLETQKYQCNTKDNVLIKASATIYWKIKSPHDAVYNIDILPDSLKDTCLKALRTEIGKVPFDEIISKRNEISQAVTKELADKINAWGIQLNRIEVGELDFDGELANALKKRRIAEAEKDASIAKADCEAMIALKKIKTDNESKKLQLEAENETLIKKAEAQREMQKIETQSETEVKKCKADSEASVLLTQTKAEAESKKILAAAELDASVKVKEAEIKYFTEMTNILGADHAVEILKARTAVEGLKALSENSSNKLVFLPNNMKGVLNAVVSDQKVVPTVPLSVNTD